MQVVQVNVCVTSGEIAKKIAILNTDLKNILPFKSFGSVRQARLYLFDQKYS